MITTYFNNNIKGLLIPISMFSIDFTKIDASGKIKFLYPTNEEELLKDEFCLEPEGAKPLPNYMALDMNIGLQLKRNGFNDFDIVGKYQHLRETGFVTVDVPENYKQPVPEGRVLMHIKTLPTTLFSGWHIDHIVQREFGRITSSFDCLIIIYKNTDNENV